MVARGREAGLDRAFGCRIEAFERRYQGAGLEELELEVAPRDTLDHGLQALAGRAEVREVARKCALHLPLHPFLGARARLRSPERRQQGNACRRQ